LFILGLLIFLTPVISMLMAGVKTQDDMIQWLMEKPLEYALSIRMFMGGGLGLMGLSAATYALHWGR
jgi:hypothetical protein